MKPKNKPTEIQRIRALLRDFKKEMRLEISVTQENFSALVFKSINKCQYEVSQHREYFQERCDSDRDLYSEWWKREHDKYKKTLIEYSDRIEERISKMEFFIDTEVMPKIKTNENIDNNKKFGGL
jgi:hypothetical protein